MIDKGVVGARHMIDKQAQGARERHFQEQGEDAILVLDVIRIEVQEKVNQCARPR